MKSISRILVVGLIAVAVPTLSPIPASAADLTVNLTTDTGDGTCSDGTCTLRDAILEANAAPFDLDAILFNIPDTPITPTSPLPAITDTVIIDGFSDPSSPRVELNGASVVGTPPDGLRLSTADNSTIKGLVINGFTEDGIHIQTGANNNRIEGNYIGTNTAGSAADSNGAEGVHLQGSNNIIGGSTDVARNVISGNGSNGVRIVGAGATGNRVEGNYIGTNAAGTGAVANSANGIAVTTDADNNVIGGTTASLRNVISGNGNNGVRIFALNTTGNVVQGNFIGTTSDGTGGLGNAVAGIGIDTSAAGNTVGGTAAGAGNVISGNTQDGVEISGAATTGNGVLGNSISGNGNATAPHNELGIDLVGTNAVDANDLGDPDTGPNNLQNFPIVTSAASNASTTTVGGTLNSEASKTYRLEFFSNSACDPSGNGEGQAFLGSTSATTDGSGNANFTASLQTPSTVGHVVTATATDPNNNTSEFSACSAVVFDPTPPSTPDTTPPTTPTTNAGPRFQKQRVFTVTWSTSTDPTGPVRYDVRYREAPYNGGFGGFVNWQTSITATTATFIGTPGTTYCFSARAVDGAGNASAYGAEGCTAVPVDNPAFKHRGKWGKKTGAGYYLNTFSRTKKKGATLTLPGVQAKALSIIVTKCRECGIINVFFKGNRVRRINLRSKAAARQKLRFVNLKTFGSVQTGMVRVRVVSRGKLVIVEGLGVSAV